MIAAQAAEVVSVSAGLPLALQLGGWAVAIVACIVVPVLWARLVKVEDARVEEVKARESLERRIDALEGKPPPKQ